MSNSKPKNYQGRVVDMRRIPYYHRVGPLLTNLREDIYKSLIKLGFTIELASLYSNTPMEDEIPWNTYHNAREGEFGWGYAYKNTFPFTHYNIYFGQRPGDIYGNGRGLFLDFEMFTDTGTDSLSRNVEDWYKNGLLSKHPEVYSHVDMTRNIGTFTRAELLGIIYNLIKAYAIEFSIPSWKIQHLPTTWDVLAVLDEPDPDQDPFKTSSEYDESKVAKITSSIKRPVTIDYHGDTGIYVGQSTSESYRPHGTFLITDTDSPWSYHNRETRDLASEWYNSVDKEHVPADILALVPERRATKTQLVDAFHRLINYWANIAWTGKEPFPVDKNVHISMSDSTVQFGQAHVPTDISYLVNVMSSDELSSFVQNLKDASTVPVTFKDRLNALGEDLLPDAVGEIASELAVYGAEVGIYPPVSEAQ